VFLTLFKPSKGVSGMNSMFATELQGSGIEYARIYRPSPAQLRFSAPVHFALGCSAAESQHGNAMAH
jgi:hypothetical protein